MRLRHSKLLVMNFMPLVLRLQKSNQSLLRTKRAMRRLLFHYYFGSQVNSYLPVLIYFPTIVNMPPLHSFDNS